MGRRRMMGFTKDVLYTIHSNIPRAEVYVDSTYYGETDAYGGLTINVKNGMRKHIVRLKAWYNKEEVSEYESRMVYTLTTPVYVYSYGLKGGSESINFESYQEKEYRNITEVKEYKIDASQETNPEKTHIYMDGWISVVSSVIGGWNGSSPLTLRVEKITPDASWYSIVKKSSDGRLNTITVPPNTSGRNEAALVQFQQGNYGKMLQISVGSSPNFD